MSLGMLVTGAISAVTNSLLPYVYGDFRFCDVGTLSTLAFALAVGLATFFHGLFDLRVILREMLVYGLLLTFVLGAYGSAIFVISQHLTSNAEKWRQFVVLFLLSASTRSGGSWRRGRTVPLRGARQTRLQPDLPPFARTAVSVAP